MRCLLALLLLIPLVSAQVEVLNANQTVFSGERADFLVRVANPFDQPLGLEIAVEGEHLEWKVPTLFYLMLDPNETQEFNLSFLPISREEETADYMLRLSGDGILWESAFTLRVLPEVWIHGVTAEIKENILTVHGLVKVRDPGKKWLRFSLIRDGEAVASAETWIWVKNESSFDQNISIHSLSAGDYQLKIESRGSEFYLPVRIEPIKDVIERVQVSQGFLQELIEIEIENRGTQPIENYVLERSIPPLASVTFYTKPSECQEGKCRFVIQKLEPGLTGKIIYSVSYLPTLAEGAIIAFILLVGFWLYEFKLGRPRVRKKIVRKGDEHLVILEVRSPLLRGLRNAVLKDIISPLTHLIDSGSLKPVVKKGEKGTELIWNLGNLASREVRIISYKIKSPLAAMVKLLPAKLNFEKGKKNVSVFSNQAVLE